MQFTNYVKFAVPYSFDIVQKSKVNRFVFVNIMNSVQKEKLDLSKTKTPTGTKISCKGWIQEAALRMLHNNLQSLMWVKGRKTW